MLSVLFGFPMAPMGVGNNLFKTKWKMVSTQPENDNVGECCRDLTFQVLWRVETIVTDSQ